RSKRVPPDSRASGHRNNSAWNLCVSPSRAAQRQGGEKTRLHARCGRIRSILHDSILRHECRNSHCSLDFANLSTSAVSLNRVNVRLHFWGRSRQRTRLARIRNQPRRWTGTLGWRFDRRCGPAPSSHRLLTSRCSRIGCILSDFPEGEAEKSQFRIRCELGHNDVLSSNFVHEPVTIFEVDEPVVALQLPTFEQHVVLSRLSQLKNIRALVPDLDSPSPIFS